METMPALVKSAGRSPTVKLGDPAAVTLDVNCDIRRRTRSVVTATGGPATDDFMRTCTSWPGSSWDVSMAAWKEFCNALGTDNPSDLTWNEAELRVTTTGVPRFMLLVGFNSLRITNSK